VTTFFGTVCHTETLSPSMQRIVFDGDGLADFTPADATDQYVNVLFVPDGAPYSVPFDADAAREHEPELRPRGRRYTVRSWDAGRLRLTIDFVVHGDVGLACRWAQRATIGDRLQMVGPNGRYLPDVDADWHLMVGDESALPAIGASLEALQPDALCVVVAVVDTPHHTIDLPSSPTTDIRWHYRCTALDPETTLLDAVASLDWPAGDVDVFVKGEAAEVRAVRRFLIAERGVDKNTASISPYWRRDCTDEAWREIKQQWLAEQDADA